MPKTLERNKSQQSDMPEGFTQVGRGNLPPFFDLHVGQSLEGILQAHRMETKIEKVRVRGGKTEERESFKHYFDIKLLKDAEGEDASRNHNDVSHKAGTLITLSGSGALVRSFTEAAMRASGQEDTDWPTDGTEPKVEWSKIVGLEVYVKRLTDGKMSQKSKFPGNKVKQYAVGVKFQG